MNRFGYSIFCDDIRNEAGGKLSFIGCYNGIIFVPPQFPLVLPRFCVHIHIFSPASLPFSSIVARCYAPGHDAPIFEQLIDPPEKAQQLELVANLEADPATPLYIVASTSLIFAPLHISGPGLIRIRALVDETGEEIKLGSLRIESRQPDKVEAYTTEHAMID